MLKKFLLSMAIIGVSSSAFAMGNYPYAGFAAGIKNNSGNTVNFRGADAAIFVGYSGMMSANFSLAGEVFVVPVTTSINDNGLKSNRDYGFSILPSIAINESSSVFVRLGIVRTSFEGAGASKETVAGAQMGIGTQTSIAPHWDLRGEYDYTAYKEYSRFGKVKSDQVFLGLVYKMD